MNEERALSELSRTEYLRRIASALESLAMVGWVALVLNTVGLALFIVKVLR